MQVKKKSQKQERSVAKDLNAKTVVASGALWGSKGDVRHDQFLVECKTTDKSFYSLTMKVWEKIEKEAVKDGLRIPVMCVDVNGGSDRYAVFREKHFKHYKNFYECASDDTVWSDKFSFCVDTPKRVLMLLYKDHGETLTFDIVPWYDFLYMIGGGENETI